MYHHCTLCKQDKPAQEFNRNRSTQSGLHYHCKECTKAYRAELIKKQNERVKQWQQDNPHKWAETLPPSVLKAHRHAPMIVVIEQEEESS